MITCHPKKIPKFLLKGGVVQFCHFIQFVMILFYILTISLTFPFLFARQKQFGTFGKKNIGLKNTKVAWGSRPWRAERRKCSSQIMFGSLNSISTLAKMLLMMMSVIIFGTKTYNNTSHWMIYDSVTPSTFLDKLTTSNQVINCNEDILRVRERHRIIFALLSLIIMKESNHFYIYTLYVRIHLRVESQNIQIYANALHSISLSFRPVLTQRACHFEQVFKTEKFNISFPAWDTKYIVKGTTTSAFYWLLTFSKDFIISWQR